jgi:hypothetical protein
MIAAKSVCAHGVLRHVLGVLKQLQNARTACRAGTLVVFVALASNVMQKRQHARAEKITSPVAISPAKPPPPLPTRSGHISDELHVLATQLTPVWTPSSNRISDSRLNAFWTPSAPVLEESREGSDAEPELDRLISSVPAGHEHRHGIMH